MWSSNLFFYIQLFPAFLIVQVFQGPGFSESKFFRVQVFQGPGFSESRFFRVQVFQGRVQGLGPGFRSSPYNLIKITFRHGCSPVNLLHIFRTPFPRNTSGWLLLVIVFFEINIISSKSFCFVLPWSRNYAWLYQREKKSPSSKTIYTLLKHD